MVVKTNWRDVVPNIGHQTAIVWPLLGPAGGVGLEGFQALTMHTIQPHMAGDYHVHFDREQIYYFTYGSGKMNIDEVIYPVKKGDAVCVPITAYHHMINDTDDYLTHLIINGKPVPENQQEKNKEIIAATKGHGTKMPIAHRHWLDGKPHVSHGAALMWSIFGPKGQEGKSYNEAPAEGIQKVTLHRLQPRQSTGVHTHTDKEQVYYFTEGRGKMIVGDETFDVEEGDAVYGPPHIQHGLINDTNDWLEHLIISAAGGEAGVRRQVSGVGENHDAWLPVRRVTAQDKGGEL